MQLGTRWTAGGTIPPSVPELFHSTIRDVERQLAAYADEDLAARAWTLTWLEGNPTCRLDSGLTLTIKAGAVVIHNDDADETDDDSWLEN